MTVGDCELGSDNIIATYEQPPADCAMLCKFGDGCNFWRANWDGSECLLLTTDFHQVHGRRSSVFHQDCQSFAGSIAGSIADCQGVHLTSC